MSRWKQNKQPLKTRIVLSSLLGIAVTFMLAAGLLTWSFNQAAQRSLDNYLLAFLNTLIAATSVDTQGHVKILPSIAGFENIPYYWQINERETPLAKSKQLRAPLALETVSHGNLIRFSFQDSDQTEVYALKRTVRFPGHVPVSYMMGIQKDAATEFVAAQEGKFLLPLIGILVTLAVVLLSLSLVQIRIITKPLTLLRQSIGEIKKGNISELSEPFPKEIQPLVNELNTLLSYNQHMLERYRTFSSNLSHALKTPLAVLKNDAAGSADPLAAKVLEKVDAMHGLINRYLARVRIGGTVNLLGVKTPLSPILTKITTNFGKLYAKEYRLSCPEELLLQVDEADLFELLGNIIENAYKYGKDAITVSAEKMDTFLVITIGDDGPGIEEAQRNEVLKRGVRLDEKQEGSGIGIPIAVDIAKLYGGEITLGESALGGLQVAIMLPDSLLR
jgi:signal transduction histidine kinase